MKFSPINNNLLIALTISTILILLWMFTLFSNSENNSPIYQIIELSILIVFIFSTYALLHNASRFGYKNIIGKGLYFLSFGLIAFISSHIIWIYYIFLTDKIIPFPSLIDSFYILIIPSFIIGIWYLTSIYSRDKKILVFFKRLIMLFIVSILYSIFIGFPPINIEQTRGQLFFNIIYPLLDILNISMLVILLKIIKKRFYSGIGLIMISSFLITLVNIISSIEIGKNVYINGGISDQILIISGFLMGIGGILVATHFKTQDKIT